MNDILIADIAQLKQAEINTLNAAVIALQQDLTNRQAGMDALQTRAQHFQDRLSRADTQRSSALAQLKLAQATSTAATALAGASDSARQQAGSLERTLNQIAEKKVALLDQLTLLADLLEKASQLANKQKAGNPQIPDPLISLIGQADSDCANTVALALAAQGGCILAASSMATSHGSLTLVGRQASALCAQLRQETTPEPADDSVLGQLQALYQQAVDHYHATLALSSNASTQLDHANALLATRKARLASLQAGLAAAMGVGAAKKGK